MAKRKEKPPMTAAHKSFLESVPPEHQAAFSESLADAPEAHRGLIITDIQALRALNVPLLKILALIPLMAAAYANPTTGIGPLVLAVAALFKPQA